MSFQYIRPKAAGFDVPENDDQTAVSTHSRPKAAGRTGAGRHPAQRGFNTQPPEGGWQNQYRTGKNAAGFNTQPPEGGWFRSGGQYPVIGMFQHTAARRRLA